MSGHDNGGICPDCGGPLIREGAVVEHRMNTDVFGVVIGFMGSLVGVRVSPSLAVMWFHEFELRAVEDDEFDGGAKEEPPVAADNIIDFTRSRELRANTKTRGAA